MATTNPSPIGGFPFNLSIPELEMRMVSADALEEYEHWFGFASALFAAAVGFVVPYLDSITHKRPQGDVVLLVCAVLFVILTGASAKRATTLRGRIKAGAKTYAMQAVDAQSPRPPGN